MIRGNARLEAVVRLKLRGFNGIELEVDAIIDTGLTGSLTIPSSIVETLGVEPRASGSVRLADASRRTLEMFAVVIEWEDRPLDVLASAVGEEVLIGMQLFADYELKMESRDGGLVQATRIS